METSVLSDNGCDFAGKSGIKGEIMLFESEKKWILENMKNPNEIIIELALYSVRMMDINDEPTEFFFYKL